MTDSMKPKRDVNLGSGTLSLTISELIDKRCEQLKSRVAYLEEENARLRRELRGLHQSKYENWVDSIRTPVHDTSTLESIFVETGVKGISAPWHTMSLHKHPQYIQDSRVDKMPIATRVHVIHKPDKLGEIVAGKISTHLRGHFNNIPVLVSPRPLYTGGCYALETSMGNLRVTIVISGVEERLVVGVSFGDDTQRVNVSDMVIYLDDDDLIHSEKENDVWTIY